MMRGCLRNAHLDQKALVLASLAPACCENSDAPGTGAPFEVAVLGVGPREASPERATAVASPVHAKFLSAAGGDLALATKRWNETCEWRRRERVDAVLTEPQPFFDVMKKCYPHWLGGRGRGGELVYWERVGKVDIEGLKRGGMTLEALLRHLVFYNEWTWEVYSPKTAAGDPESFQITVLDLEGMRLSQVGGMRLEFLKAASEISQKHYPDRTRKYIIINAPSWFSASWRIVRSLVQPETQEKLTIARAGEATKVALLKHIEARYVPECYGGEFAPGQDIESARLSTPEELSCWAFVDAIHARHAPSSPA